MELKTILENLDDPRQKREKLLRAKIVEGFKARGKSPFEIGRLLVELHDEIIGQKLFKEYLKALGIARSNAYRWMDAFREVPELPDAVILAVEKRKIDLTKKKYRTAIRDVPLPEDPNEEEANKWVDSVLAQYLELKDSRAQDAGFLALTAEKRNALTMEILDKHFKKVDSDIGKLWDGVSPDERSLDVFCSLVSEVAARLGFAEKFTVSPAPEPGESNGLVKRLKAGVTRKRRTGRKGRRLPPTEDILTPILADSVEPDPELAASAA